LSSAFITTELGNHRLFRNSTNFLAFNSYCSVSICCFCDVHTSSRALVFALISVVFAYFLHFATIYQVEFHIKLF
jgi:hypothetical protein